ncbi:hypothetical protein niasHT_002392 [Heterodera trifolii]|uniref:B30.2/SPRY domain-containing protein n=1 Tax=Heterodera trifolii TaxID=157864 RepID=A0ABD2LMA9_9BILA
MDAFSSTNMNIRKHKTVNTDEEKQNKKAKTINYWDSMACDECLGNGSGIGDVPMAEASNDSAVELDILTTSISDTKKGNTVINASERKQNQDAETQTRKTANSKEENRNVKNNKETQQTGKELDEALLNFEQNYWDTNACHNDLEIIGDKKLTVHYYKERQTGLRFVFAKHPFFLGIGSSDIFYFEISIKHGSCPICFGFGVKRQPKSDERMYDGKDFYTYDSQGIFWINGSYKGMFEKNSYRVDDIVGCGINLISRKIFFTKNGRRMGAFDFDPSSDVYQLFPFVSLTYWCQKIEANFGPF